jgi:sugar phosphate isomerase/epimerase
MNYDRRLFLKNSSLLLSGGLLAGRSALAAGDALVPSRQEVDLLASYWTICGACVPATGPEYSSFDFRDRVEAISRAGFKGMGIWHADLYKTLETRSLAEMKQILDDNGIVHVELEFLFDWFLTGEKKKASDIEKARLLDAAEALGARHLKVGDFFNTPVELDQVTESFAALCADAADAGTNILFEIMPFSMINRLDDGLKMLDEADTPNGGFMIDTWHMIKMGVDNDTLARVPAKHILGVELNDGYLKTPEGLTLNQETVEQRKFPGEGEFDMPGFMAAVAATGYHGPYGVEVIAKSNRALPLDEVVRHAYETALSMFV